MSPISAIKYVGVVAVLTLITAGCSSSKPSTSADSDDGAAAPEASATAVEAPDKASKDYS